MSDILFYCKVQENRVYILVFSLHINNIKYLIYRHIILHFNTFLYDRMPYSPIVMDMLKALLIDNQL